MLHNNLAELHTVSLIPKLRILSILGIYLPKVIYFGMFLNVSHQYSGCPFFTVKIKKLGSVLYLMLENMLLHLLVGCVNS